MLDSIPTLTAAAGGSNLLTGIILPFGAMALIMYFLLIRPQQQQRKKHQEMIANIKKNDMIITSGGLIGKVVKVDEKEMRINLGDTEVRIVRSMVVDLFNKDTTPANTNDKKG